MQEIRLTYFEIIDPFNRLPQILFRVSIIAPAFIIFAVGKNIPLSASTRREICSPPVWMFHPHLQRWGTSSAELYYRIIFV
jgi:hypothetical protein